MKIKKWFKTKISTLVGLDYAPLCKGLAGIAERESHIFSRINGYNPRYIVIPNSLKSALEIEFKDHDNKTLIGAEFVFKDSTHIYCEGSLDEKHKEMNDEVLRNHGTIK